MIKITFDKSKAMKQVNAKISKCNQYAKGDFAEKTIKILDEEVLPNTPIRSGQLLSGMGGRTEGNKVIYTSTGERDDGKNNQEVLYHLENSHGGRDSFFIPACARAADEIEKEVGADLKVIVSKGR